MTFLLALCAMGAQVDFRHPTNSEIEQRVRDTLGQMTLDEKIDILSGVRGFYERGVPRLGVPELKMSDGPVGVRNDGPTTAYPAGTCLASSFDTNLADEFGVGIGRDARARGVHIWLGPGVNLSRIPQNGRNFEYFGEDPYLSGQTAARVVQGVQSQRVVATVKHYAANNHENDRNVDSSDVDERVLRELYLKPFEAAVKEGGAWAVMCGYNKLNGTYDSENPHLLTDVLKNDWGFKGVLMSDWGAVHSTLPALQAGMDLEMPNGDFINRQTVKPLLDSGQLSMSTIDDHVRRILRLTYAMGFADRQQEMPNLPKDNPDNEAVALKIAREGTVLLKNSGALPIDPTRVKHILVVGPNADPALTGGGGSSYTTPAEKVSLLEAIKKIAGPNIDVKYRPLMEDFVDRAFTFRGFYTPDDPNQRGLKMERFNSMDLSGTPDVSRSRGIRIMNREGGAQAPPAHFSVRWTGFARFDTSGRFLATSRSDDGIRVYLDDKLVIDDWNDHGEKVDTNDVTVEANHNYKLRVEYYQNEGDAICQFGFSRLAEDVVKELPADEIRNADVVIANVGFSPATEGEGTDRPFNLPLSQELTLRKIVSLNPRTVVVNNSGAGVDMSGWIGGANALVQAWYSGGIGNQAVAEILFGLTNPSGKLCTTFPKTLKGTYYETAYPPVDHHVAYKEGLFIGYRWFDEHNVGPLFPFGFGLSYTSFRISRFNVASDAKSGYANVIARVTNTGRREGAEVVQVYVHPQHSAVVRAVKELKGFTRVFLKPGETKDVVVPIKVSDLSYFDVPHHRWVLETGRYDLLVGTSSRHLPLKGRLDVTGVTYPTTAPSSAQ